MEEVTEIRLTKRKLKSLVYDNEKAAEAVHLIYTSDTAPGITRKRKNGNSFIYEWKGATIKDSDTLARIKSLVIPPAWTNVWICALPEGHLQATGFDAKHRKQYRYHPLWNRLRNHTKFFNLLSFGKALPAIRKQLKADLALTGLPQQKVLAVAVSLMECTCIRVGSSAYEKENGSYGLTTLKDKHVDIQGSKLRLSFKGKKGVYQDISVKSKKLARIVQACKDIPGKELFQYYNADGERRSIDSGMVNDYIKSISSGSFTAKDFRTWAGTLEALRVFKQLGCCQTEAETKKKIVEALDRVAKHLGNTRAVCRKYYVHPVILELYANRMLENYFDKIEEGKCNPDEIELSTEEETLLAILENHGNTATKFA